MHLPLYLRQIEPTLKGWNIFKNYAQGCRCLTQNEGNILVKPIQQLLVLIVYQL